MDKVKRESAAPSKKPMTKAEQRRPFEETAREQKAKPPKMTPAEQRRAFETAAREAGCSEDESVFDAALARIVKSKTAS